ncbi:Protein of unknown function, partial [Gryllus bimaculatus]
MNRRLSPIGMRRHQTREFMSGLAATLNRAPLWQCVCVCVCV